MLLKKYIGDRGFYRYVMGITLPIMIQNGITNFVSMLDNIMIGQIGTNEMTGVAVANQLIFVFNLCIFGAVSGAGIFGAQFYGKGDQEGVRHTLRFKIISGIILSLAGIALFGFGGEYLINMYLSGEGSVQNAAASLSFAKEYLAIMLIGLVPYAVAQCYAGTLRETGQTLLPMYAGIAAVFVNLVLNWVLIFGNLGAPRLGVAGGAVATVISRFAELMIVSVWTHKNHKQNPFAVGLYRSIYVPGTLVKNIFAKGLPLMMNETLWAAGIAMVNQCYSRRGLDVVAANNISQTFFNVFGVAFLSVGGAIGIILGQMLGSNDTEGAKDASRKLIFFSLMVSVVVSAVYAIAAEAIPAAYNTTDEIRHMATRLMQITALAMPLDAFANASYFTLRSGGKTFITFLFDSCFVWVVSVTAAFLLVTYTAIPILPLYAICQSLNVIKCIVGYILVKKGIWIKNIV